MARIVWILPPVSTTPNLDTGGRCIAWRVVDEYPDSGEYVITPEISIGPPTLAGLIDLLDGASYTGGDLEGGLALGWNNFNLAGGTR